MLDHGDIVVLYLNGLTEICRTGKNSSKNEFIFHPKNVILILELKTVTLIDLVLSGGEITKFNHFSVRHKNLKNQRKSRLKTVGNM